MLEDNIESRIWIFNIAGPCAFLLDENNNVRCLICVFLSAENNVTCLICNQELRKKKKFKNYHQRDGEILLHC